MKVTLNIKEGNTTHAEQHLIEEVNLFQLTKAIKVIKEILDVVSTDEHLVGVIKEFLDEVEVTEGEGPEQHFSESFMENLGGAINVLMVEIPEKAIELLGVLSGVEYDVLMQQKAEEVFDIYDAIVQVNDIEKLVVRAKKSLRLTKAQKKVMSLFKKDKKAEEQQQ